MLTFASGSKNNPSRREFLRIGTTLGGLSLPGLFAAREVLGASGKAFKDRSVVFLNMQGGPTQYETFDPKMAAPEEIRSITGEVNTSLPGVTFGGTLPRLAKLADRMAIVRSYRHGISDHAVAAKHVMAGGNPTKAMMGSLMAQVTGISHPQSGLPQNVVLTPQAVGEQYSKLFAARDRVTQIGSLDTAYKPFDPSAGGEILQNMELRIPGGRLHDRRQLLTAIDHLRRKLDTTNTVEAANRFQQQAFDVVTCGVVDAFDLSKEDPRTRERYDTGSFEPTDAVKSRNEYAAQFSQVALGKQLLLARRLCEAGCGFVTVTCSGWDMHGGGKEYTMVDGLNSLTPAFDKAVSAFIDDLYQRGLDDKILLVITGEFGRTPKINKNGGRDHWGNLCPLVFVGGGLRMGQVVGRSDRIGGTPESLPISTSNVLATIMHTLFDFGELRLQTNVSQEIQRAIGGGEPISELV